MGIDLGTDFCCVGYYDDGKIEIVPNKMGARCTPSVVAFEETCLLTGEVAKCVARRTPEHNVFEVMKLMARSFVDAQVQEYKGKWPVQLVPGSGRGVQIRIPGVPKELGEGLFDPEDISAALLKAMKEISEEFLYQRVEDVVITVPVFFNDRQCAATLDAARRAGLNVLELINEPTAAAIAFWHQGLISRRPEESNIIVFYWKKHSLDVYVIKGDCGIRVVVAETHPDIGEAEIDGRLIRHVANEYKLRTGVDLLANTRVLSMLKEEIARARRRLCSRFATRIQLYLSDIDLDIGLSRSTFLSLNEAVFEKCRTVAVEAVYGAGITTKFITDVLLVGQTTQIPGVRDMLETLFWREPLGVCRDDEHDEMVARGAACEADYQSDMVFRLYQGERALCRINRFLGAFTLSGFRPMAASGTPIVKLVLRVNWNGILYASAEAIADHCEIGKVTKLEVRLRKEQSANDRPAAIAHDEQECEETEEDRALRATFEARRDLQKLVWEIREKHFERMSISQKWRMTEVLDWLSSEDNYADKSVYERKAAELRSIMARVCGRNGLCR
ncbi:hypothetical protein CBR_g39982 [Chara braunii]|uniref:Uncharacterized protein n=1 Tax=Chara braunii TaxID=69332 RepID=A0A388LSV6_CHABU|nr:hypothetical protein CBR_g39982 [Chara braunii]|eukprot:GBG85339.1 hypothetical protein CBR_g39982 [Chara braunii]